MNRQDRNAWITADLLGEARVELRRFERLVAAGYPAGTAMTLAPRRRVDLHVVDPHVVDPHVVDLHDAIALVCAGCSPRTALEILL